jgi:hypothetical protein
MLNIPAASTSAMALSTSAFGALSLKTTMYATSTMSSMCFLKANWLTIRGSHVGSVRAMVEFKLIAYKNQFMVACKSNATRERPFPNTVLKDLYADWANALQNHRKIPRQI